MPRPLIIIFFVLLSTALAVFGLLNSDFLSSGHTSAVGFGISPPKIRAVNLKPGDKFSETVVVLRSRAVEEQRVNISLLAPKIQSWITLEPAWNSRFETGELQLPVKVTVAVPPDAETGHYAGQMYFTFRRPAGSGSVSIQTGARADIELEVDGINPIEEKKETQKIESDDSFPAGLEIKNAEMYNRLRGRILIKTEDNGQAWYVHAGKMAAYFLGRPEDAQKVMSELGEGISTLDLHKIPAAEEKMAVSTNKAGFPEALNADNGEGRAEAGPAADFNIAAVNEGDLAFQQSGKILLQVESHGEAWYVNPENKKRYFLGRPQDAFRLMQELGLGISNQNFNLLTNY